MLVKFKENRVRRAYFGGKRIDCFYGKLGENTRYPEEWLASTTEAFNPDMPKAGEGLSVTEDGKIFRDLIKTDAKRLLGEEDMSILVKLLDSAERLVIQCHPTVQFAKERMNSPFGKTECWYILDAEDDAFVYLGFKEGITREKWERLFALQDIDAMLACLHKFPVKRGELWFVAGGVPHAIGGGAFMIELQEPSDLMVIPERKTPSGVVLAEKKLHSGLGFDGMFDVYDYTGLSEDQTRAKYYRCPERKINVPVSIVDGELTDKFSMTRLTVSGNTAYDLDGSYAVATVTDGEGVIKTKSTQIRVKKSASLFISLDEGKLEFSGEFEIVFSQSRKQNG